MTPEMDRPQPLSARTRRRLLRDLLARADAGDAAAAEALIRLSVDLGGGRCFPSALAASEATT